MSAVRVVGVGLTRFGAHPERTVRDLFAEAGLAAIDDAAIDRDRIEAVHFGNFMGELAEHQGHTGPLAAESVGVLAASTRYESACASAGAAVRSAVRDIRNGEADLLLVGGAERMTNLRTAGATEALAIAADDLYEVRAGVTFPGAYALMQRAYVDAHDSEQTDLAEIARKNHEHAVENEYAQYREPITVADHQDSPMIADPIRLYDACPITDGAAALVLASEDYVRTNRLDGPIAITGTGQGGDRMALQDREFLTRTPASTAAADEAYADAGIGPEDVELAEVHDCFTIAEVLAIESLGFYEVGEGIGAARRGETTMDGPRPVNLSGGLKAKGHPVGATGASQIVELTRLLRGDHPHSDAVTDASVGVSHNAGGTVASAIVHVLERVR